MDEANRFFGVPDPGAVEGMTIAPRQPAEVRAAFTARHVELLAAMG